MNKYLRKRLLLTNLVKPPEQRSRSDHPCKCPRSLVLLARPILAATGACMLDEWGQFSVTAGEGGSKSWPSQTVCCAIILRYPRACDQFTLSGRQHEMLHRKAQYYPLAITSASHCIWHLWFTSQVPKYNKRR